MFATFLYKLKLYRQLQMLNQTTNLEEQLTDTGSSNSRKSSINEEPTIHKKKRYSKKRIGPYSYRSRNVVGCGFSSLVYKGIKNDDKTHLVAIKVVKLADLSQNRRGLLSNEVKLMKKLNHPNIVKLLDVYYTINNCYIVTEFCEGGSLQHYIDANDKIEAEYVIKQIGSACQYLASVNILHRDIKPANILLKKGEWKLGDFGFSQQLPHFNAIIKGDHLIGSPLFMPIQSLTMNLYSSKTDSFAMGVLIFYLLTGNYPWKVQDQQGLIHQLNHIAPNQKYLNLLPPTIKHCVQSLLSREMSQRMHLLDCDFQAFTHVKRLKDQTIQPVEPPNKQSIDSIPDPIGLSQL